MTPPRPADPSAESGDSPAEARFLRLAVGIGLVAAGARIWGFLTAGSLWLDELFMATNFRELSFTGLAGPLLDGQNAPILWLWLEKLLWETLGRGERILRLPSLVASLVSLPLTYAVARRVVGPAYGLIPLAVVGFSPFVLWQGLQVKPYAGDLAVALAVLWTALRALDRRPGAVGLLAGAGLLAIFGSMASIFVLAGVGTTLLIEALRDPQPEKRPRLLALATVGGLWLAAFVFNLVTLLRPRAQPGWLFDYWEVGLLGRPADLAELASWLPRVLVGAMADPMGFLGLGPVVLVPALVAAGLWVRDLWRRPADAGSRRALGFFVLPVVFALGASALRLYPFASRLLLFLVPSLAVSAAYGLRWGMEKLRPAARRIVLPLAYVPLLVPLALFLLWLPRGGLPIAADSRSLFESLDRERRPGETVILDHLAVYAWRHYGDPGAAGVVEVPSAWTDRDRRQGLRQALHGVDGDVAWVAVTRVTDPRGWTFPEAVVRDLWHGWWTFPETYDRFVAEQTRWSPAGSFRGALRPGWKVERELEVYGGRLWRVVRESPEPASNPQKSPAG